MLPNFLCIGAQKCGTTTLWHILDAHPDICMAQPRETRFFYDVLQFAEGIQKYEIRYFSHWAGQSAVGEKCPEYLYVPPVVQRVYDLIGPDTRFIVTLRSPAQRAYSHYRHNMAMISECRTFDEILCAESQQQGDELAAHYAYLARGFYAKQLEAYLRRFDRDQFLLINFETEIATNQQALADRLYNFLGVEQFCPEGMPFITGHPQLENLAMRIKTDRLNPKKRFVEINQDRRGFHRLLKRIKGVHGRENNNPVRRIYNPSPDLIEFAQGFINNKPTESRLPRAQEVEINRRYFIDDIKQLRKIVPFKVDHWLEI